MRIAACDRARKPTAAAPLRPEKLWRIHWLEKRGRWRPVGLPRPRLPDAASVWDASARRVDPRLSVARKRQSQDRGAAARSWLLPDPRRGRDAELRLQLSTPSGRPGALGVCGRDARTHRTTTHPGHDIQTRPDHTLAHTTHLAHKRPTGRAAKTSNDVSRILGVDETDKTVLIRSSSEGGSKIVCVW